ncbi:ribosomal protein L11, putative [Plasmodium ovale curtisi]|uniref:Ribosomal protein L11, putative n=1 Tax=Plasmodium ovale curtisi TaxID=864141 RepID=A0A1A8VS91_PLAOA|nr:ribosomal protein L11, putative [Plasmodium ovale curtisi]
MSRIGRFNLIVLAGSAKPSASIGQTLGPLGINMMTFFKEFNERTKNISKNVPIQVTLEPLDDSVKTVENKANAIIQALDEVKCRYARRTGFICEPQPSSGLSGGVPGFPCSALCPNITSLAQLPWRSMGIKVCRELDDDAKKKYFVDVNQLDNIKKGIRTRNKHQKRSKK